MVGLRKGNFEKGEKMKFRQIIILLLVVVFVLGSLGVLVAAKEESQKGEREEPRKRPSREEMIERYMSRLKEELAPTDEQWKGLEPKLKTLIGYRIDLRRFYFARFRGFFARRRHSETEEEEATPEGQLSKLLQDESAEDDAIKAKLTKVREARKEEGKKNREKMKLLREQIGELETELKELLTIRQEAVLVLRGIIS